MTADPATTSRSPAAISALPSKPCSPASLSMETNGPASGAVSSKSRVMLHRTSDRFSVVLLFLFLFLTSTLGACDRTQTVSVTAEDFRFTPELVTVSSAFPLVLTIYNSGREVHEFDSPVLMYAAETSSTISMKKTGIVLEPGKSVQLTMAPPPGTFLYICRRKGHANMAGTLIVE
jgi:uncharacterized cupredoxin-like copper-binding protein